MKVRAISIMRGARTALDNVIMRLLNPSISGKIESREEYCIQARLKFTTRENQNVVDAGLSFPGDRLTIPTQNQPGLSTLQHPTSPLLADAVGRGGNL